MGWVELKGVFAKLPDTHPDDLDEHYYVVRITGDGDIEPVGYANEDPLKAVKWLRFIADTQHRLLDAFRVELSDEEWAAFAEALGIEP